ncbi:MAG: response regulator transcription factor [Treponema sp.]
MNVIIIDDDPLVVSSLTTILTAQGITVPASGSDGDEAAALFQRYTPDILLMDIRMRRVSGIEAAEAVLQTDKTARILLLTTFDDEEYITRALHFGCKGYLLKQNIQALIPALNAVMAGSIVFDSEILAKLPQTQPGSKSFPELNERETEVLDFLAEGFNNKEIAERLSLSEGTVRNYISSILDKLKLRDRTQLLVYYYTK